MLNQIIFFPCAYDSYNRTSFISATQIHSLRMNKILMPECAQLDAPNQYIHPIFIMSHLKSHLPPTPSHILHVVHRLFIFPHFPPIHRFLPYSTFQYTVMRSILPSREKTPREHSHVDKFLLKNASFLRNQRTFLDDFFSELYSQFIQTSLKISRDSIRNFSHEKKLSFVKMRQHAEVLRAFLTRM